MRKFLAAASLAAFTVLSFRGLPAQASTLPRVDFKPGDKMIAAGLLDLNFDYAWSDRLSVGGTLIPNPTPYHWSQAVLSPVFFALRSSYKIGELWPGVPFGVTLSTGVTVSPVQTDCGSGCRPFDLSMGIPNLLTSQYLAWVQPALNISIPMSERLKLRATVGPIVTLNGSFGFEPHLLPLPIPNVELAYALDDRHEITVLGNALLGWRGTF